MRTALLLTVCLTIFSQFQPVLGQELSVDSKAKLPTKRLDATGQPFKVAQARNQANLSRRAQGQLLEGQNKVDANANTTTIITSRTLGGAPMVMARDLSTLLDDGERFEKMRIVPVVARGKVQNLWDILYLKGIDVGWVQADTFEYLKNAPNIASIKRRLAYISKVFPAEVHIVARKDIKTLQDLAGQTVSINAKGTGSSVVATILFERFGIAAKAIHEDGGRAIARMKKGEIAAHFWVLGKPARPVRRLKAEDGLHLLPIPYSETLEDIYYPAKFSHQDYPAIVPEGGDVDTISVGNVLAVYNWPETHERYKKVAKFVRSFFSRLPELRSPGFHPKWKQVNIYSQVRGWQRFKAAQEWIDAGIARRKQQRLKVTGKKLFDSFGAFKKHLESKDVQIGDVGDRDRMQQLFQQYLQWHNNKRSN
ncbi:MAG: TAXI family TRAP transporter solute-binding subunit [Hyphomicrobiaceae bacterium]